MASLRIDTRVYTDLARAEYFIVIYIETDGRTNGIGTLI